MTFGEINRYWGLVLQNGFYLYEVPDYLSDSDFPYKKRPYNKEVLWADRLSVVRLLGGYKEFPGLGNLRPSQTGHVPEEGLNSAATGGDLDLIRELSKYDFAYRNSSGKIEYRPHLIKERLKPYLDNGYEEFTLVLDNFPWDLSSNKVVGRYGNPVPPDDPEEWYAMVKELCRVLIGIMGEEKANNLRFRIGTEMNGVKRFAGTEDYFITHYDYTAAAVHEILPKVSVSLFNLTGASVGGIKNSHNVGMFRVLEHISTQNNRKTGKPTELLPNVVSTSRYYAEINNLDQVVQGIDDVWDYIDDNVPGYKGKFSREIHEFGALGNWRSQPPTHNPDAFGNAMNLQVIMNLKANGLDQLFHWNMLDEIEDGTGNVFSMPSTHAWGFNVLDYMAGGEAYKVFPERRYSKDKTEFTSMLSTFDNKAYLLVTAFNKDRTQHEKNSVVIKLPKSLFGFEVKKARSACSNNGNSMNYQMRHDLEANGLLIDTVAEKPEYVCGFNRMITAEDEAEASRMVLQNQDRYKAMWKDSLTLHDFEGKIQETEDAYVFTFDMVAPESRVILLK